MTFLFPFPSHSHRIIPISGTSIPIPTHSHSYFRHRLYIDYTLKPRNMYIVWWIQNKIWNYSRSIVNQTHHSSVIIIIITITAYHCSLLNVYQTLTALLWKKQQAVHTAGGNFIFYHMKYAIPIPISSSKLLPFPWESHGNGNSHFHAHLYTSVLKYVIAPPCQQ